MEQNMFFVIFEWFFEWKYIYILEKRMLSTPIA